METHMVHKYLCNIIFNICIALECDCCSSFKNHIGIYIYVSGILRFVHKEYTLLPSLNDMGPVYLRDLLIYYKTQT